MDKVSIIITSYNLEDYIERCIKSIINQSYRNIEIIIVDDGSIDRTVEVIKKYKIIDSRIKLIQQQNSGVQVARITGLNKSTGKYVLFIDGDDWLDLDATKYLYQKAENSNSDIVYYTYYTYYSKEKNWICKMPDLKFDDKFQFLENVLNANLQAGLCLKFIRREFIIDNKINFPTNTGFGEDLASTVLLAIKKPRVDYLNKPLYYYFKRTNSVTQYTTSKVFDICITIDLIKQYLEEHKVYELFKDEYEFLIYSHIYIARVISLPHNEKYHKEFANIWREFNINIEKNRCYKEYIKHQGLKRKIKLKCYNKSYNIGLIYSIITEKIKNIN